MTSASVTLHESNFSVHADTLVLHWMWEHHGKATRQRKPDEWRITWARAKAGGLRATASEAGRALPATPTASPGRRHHLRQHSPHSLAPFHLRRQTVGRREIACSRWGHLLWLAHPSIVSLSHVTYSCFLVWQHFKTGLFSFGWDTKGKRGEEKLTRPLFAPAQIFWKSWHQEKNQLKSQQKRRTPSPTKSRHAPLQLPSPLSL